MPSCYTDQELAELIRAHGGVAHPSMQEHLASCQPCRVRWSNLQRDEQLFHELRTVANEPAIAPEEPPGPGRFGPWELLAELQRGGQGVVYRARAAAGGEASEQLAVKVLLRGRDASTRERLRFEREVDLVSGLLHPSIPRVLEHGECNGRAWYAMELVEGESLDRWRAHTSRLDERLNLFQEVLEAVAHAHRNGVIHRDLKPANVLVDAGGHAHVLDFGLAKPAGCARTNQPAVTASDEFLGTLAYAAPEQLVGGTSAIDTRTDVHALGVMLYELVTDQLPFPVEGGLESAVRAITEGEARDPRRLAGGVDADLATIVLRALAKDPTRRYSSAEALARDLARFRAGEAIEARVDSSWYLLRKVASKHVLGLALAALALLLSGGALAAFLVQHGRVQEQAGRRQRLRSLVEDVLAAARPDRMGGEVTLLELFEEVADDIEQELQDAPDEQAALQFTIGDTYRRLLMPEQAEHHLRAALAGYRASDANGLDLARCLHRLGLVLIEGSMDEAKAVQEEALAIRLRRLGEDDVLVAESMIALAEARCRAYLEPEPEEAAPLLAQALTIAREAEAPDADVLVQALIAAALEADEVRAQELGLEAIALIDAGRVQDELVELQALNHWASSLERRGRFEQAARWLERVADRTRVLYGEARSSQMLRRWANHHWRRGDLAASEELSRQALANELRAWAHRRPAVAAELEDLATRLIAGEDAWLAAFGHLRAFEGDGNWEVASWEEGIAMLLERVERFEPALALHRDSLRTHCRIWGEDCPIRVSAHENLANLLDRLGRPREALTHAEAAYAIRGRIGRLEDEGGSGALALLERLRNGSGARSVPE